MNILTGGAGFIGSTIAKGLASNGAEVVTGGPHPERVSAKGAGNRRFLCRRGLSVRSEVLLAEVSAAATSGPVGWHFSEGAAAFGNSAQRLTSIAGEARLAS